MQNNLPTILAATLFAASLGFGVSTASAATHGKCGYDAAQFKFAGDDQTQARCLLRFVKKYAHIDNDPITLPKALKTLIGTSTADVADKVKAYLAAADFDAGVPGGNDLTNGLSHANGGSASAPAARYFVIHDTSSPNLGQVAAFPADIDSSNAVNRLAGHGGSNSKAHVFINRRGEWLTGHDFRVPWRATKLEVDIVKQPSKGLFLHIELIQPRRNDANGIDALSPEPGFTAEQYDVLAIAYIAASVRGGKWLIPAFHAALDEGLNDGHDDPQHFELATFSAAVETQLAKMTED